MATNVNATFAQYRIERELHRGPNATSYEAFDTVLERRVLLKVLQPTQDAARLFEQFRVEALAYARLQHPNVVTLYQFDTWEGRPFLVLEFVDGPDLRALIETRGSLPIDVALTIARDVFRALAYAHEHGVLHRDLKPSNVLVARDGWSKVADFGLAAFVGREPSPSTGVTGTLAYMAPEVLQGAGATERSDLYSAGATLYEMLTGRRLFESDDPTTCAQGILAGRWEPLDQCRPDLPARLVRFVHRLLSAEPGERPGSATEAAENLVQLAADEGLSLRAETVRSFLAERPARPLRQARRHALQRTSRMASALLGALVILVTLAVGLGWFWHHHLDLPAGLQVVPQRHPVSVRRNAPVLHQRGPTSPRVSSTVRSAVAASREAVRKAKAQMATPAPPASPASAESQASKIQTPENAWLVVRCTPWAEVEIDGALLGTVSPEGQFRLQSGKHTLVLHHPDFPPCSLAVALRPTQRETLRVNLWARIAQLRVQVAPWAEVWIDDRHVDTTPIDKPLILPPGKHEVELRNPAYRPWRKILRLNPGTKVTLRVSLATGYWELVQ